MEERLYLVFVWLGESEGEYGTQWVTVLFVIRKKVPMQLFQLRQLLWRQRVPSYWKDSGTIWLASCLQPYKVGIGTAGGLGCLAVSCL